MSEKQQGTTSNMREKMLQRYGDGFHHKHDKNPNHYRQHCKTHPVQILNGIYNGIDIDNNHGSTGFLRKLRLRKFRKRLDKGSIH